MYTVPFYMAPCREQVFKRTLSAVICDNAPINSDKVTQLELPRNAMRIGDLAKCSEIKEESSYNFEELAKEIVDKLGNIKVSFCRQSSSCSQRAGKMEGRGRRQRLQEL